MTMESKIIGLALADPPLRKSASQENTPVSSVEGKAVPKNKKNSGQGTGVSDNVIIHSSDKGEQKGISAHRVRNSEQVKTLKEKKEDETQTSRFLNTSIHYKIDSELHTVIAKIVDNKTGKAIKQIPPEELVKIAKMLDKAGLVLNKEV